MTWFWSQVIFVLILRLSVVNWNAVISVFRKLPTCWLWRKLHWAQTCNKATPSRAWLVGASFPQLPLMALLLLMWLWFMSSSPYKGCWLLRHSLTASLTRRFIWLINFWMVCVKRRWYEGSHLYVFVDSTGLLSSFVEVESIKRHFKSRLVGTVLNGYLCLRKLVVQRTKLIDETQDMLLEMLEDMTTGLHWLPV